MLEFPARRISITEIVSHNQNPDALSPYSTEIQNNESISVI